MAQRAGREGSHASLVGGPIGLGAILLVTLAAAAFRLPWLGQLPPGLAADEARIGLDALDLLTDGWARTPGAAGRSFTSLRSARSRRSDRHPWRSGSQPPSPGSPTRPALFLLGRQIGGTRLGLAAGLLGAVVFWHADTTRGAWGYGAWGLACETVGVALLLRTVRRPDTGLTVLAALAFGLALQVSWAALAALGAGLAAGVRRPDCRGRRCHADAWA